MLETSQIIITLCVLTKISDVQQIQNYYCSDWRFPWGRVGGRVEGI